MDRKTSRSVYYRKNLNIDTYFENLIQEVLLVVDLSVKMKKKKIKEVRLWGRGRRNRHTALLLKRGQCHSELRKKIITANFSNQMSVRKGGIDLDNF